MDSQYKLLSELLLDQAAFITPPETSLANYWGALPPCPPPPVSTGLVLALCLIGVTNKETVQDVKEKLVCISDLVK